MSKTILTILAVLTIGAMSVAADLSIMDIDGASYELTGTLTTVAGSDGNFLTNDRWASDTIIGSSRVGVLPDPQTDNDIYWRKTGLSIPVSSARYIEVHYRVNGAAFAGDNHRLFLYSSTGASGGVNMANAAQVPGTAGTHSFIIDTASGGYAGNWTQFRWDMWNDLGQDGKSITIDKVVFGSAIQVPVETGYPRLLFNHSDIPALQQKVQSGWLQDAFTEMISRADTYMNVSANPYPMSGSGNGNATAGRAINERVNTLALTGMLLDDNSYIDHAIAMCISAISQTDVNDYYGYNGHLSIADGLHAYAVAYDWLYNYMTPSERSALYDEIIEFMDWVYTDSVNGGTGKYEPTPMSSNHNSVHHGALGLAALVTSTNVTPELERAVAFVEGYYRYARDATGYNSEGIGYYGYGSLGAVPFSLAYERAGYGSLIDDAQKNPHISEFVLRYIQPWGGNIVALNDSPDRLDIGSGMMEFVSRYEDRVGLWSWLKLFGPDGDGTYSGPDSSYIGMGCTLPYTILFADETLQPLSPAAADLPLGKFFDRGSGSFRSSWEDDAALATFTCGPDIHRGHNHRDEGSFTLSAFGEYFVIDPTYKPDQSRAHNVVHVNGVGQDKEPSEYDTYGLQLANKDFGDAWYMKGDATVAYRDFLNLNHALRQFLFVNAPQPYIIVSDDIEDKAGSATNVFSWLLHTAKDNTITMGSSPDEFYIQGSGSAVCYVKFLNPTNGLTIQETDLTGETFEVDGSTYNYSSYFKEVTAEYTGVNPKFTAILIAAESMANLPMVGSVQTTNGLQVQVNFPIAGIEDEVLVTDETMDFQRFEGGNALPGDPSAEEAAEQEESKVYYLQGSMPAGDSILDAAYWFDQRTAGNAMPGGESFVGNRFDVNRNYWRAPNTSGSAVFDGKLVVDHAGSGLLVHYCGNLMLNGGMELDSHLVVRPHRTSVSLTVADLRLGVSGELIFRTLVPDKLTQNLSVGNLTGSGTLQFGTGSSTTNGVWSVSVDDQQSAFNGMIQLVSGELTFNQSLVLADALFKIEPTWANQIVLNADVIFKRLTFGTKTLLSGSYTAADLNVVLVTDRFSGPGILTVVPQQGSFASWAMEYGLTGDDALPDADLEPDGMNNLLEYAFGGNPVSDDAAQIQPASYIVQASGTNWMEYVYHRRTDAEARGLQYEVLVCTNLVEGLWFNTGPETEYMTGPIDADLESVINRIPTVDSELFITLEVSEE